MGVYTRPDSAYYYLLLNGYTDGHGNPLREKTSVRKDADTALQRRDDRALAEQLFYARMHELAREGGGGVIKREKIAFDTFLDWWETHKLPQRRGREREALVLPRLRAAFGRRLLSSIDRHAAEEYITERLATPTVIRQGEHTRSVTAGPNTVNREVDLLKTILQSAVPKYLEASPLYGMKRLRTVTPKRRLMTEAEESQLLAVMEDDDKALFLIALDSLVRLADCLDLTWGDDRKDRLWVSDPKAGGGFEVPLSKRSRKALDAIKPKAKDLNTSAYIFARRRVAKTERDRRGSIQKMLRMYCRLANNLPYGRVRGGLTFHWATRRTGATRMLTRHVDVGTVQKVGRWKNPDVVLGIYHELIDDKAHAAVESVGRRKRRQAS